jgi:hypothetical protein
MNTNFFMERGSMSRSLSQGTGVLRVTDPRSGFGFRVHWCPFVVKENSPDHCALAQQIASL